VTPHVNHRQALEDCVSFADSEIQRLATPPDAAITDPGKAYRAAWKILKGDKVETEAVDKAMTDAQASGLSEKYLTLLKDAAPASAATPTEEP
jgi:flagella basal body P-ring formation protein FlgA